jgi:putative peptide maturation system protein
MHPTFSPAFDQALRGAITLLQDVPRRREDVPSAKRQFAAYQQSHPDVPARLAVELPPGEERADYDVLLDAGDGTLAVSWSADDAMPWFVDHADHWAASHVVTVNRSSLTVQEALQVVRIAGTSYPDLHDLLIRDVLRREAMEGAEEIDVTDAEIQEAADEFRQSNGLRSAEATLRWLVERGLSVQSFQRLLRGGVQARKARAKLTADRVEPFFDQHATLFDTLTIATAEFRNPTLREEIRIAAVEQGLAEAMLALARRADVAPPRLTVEERRAHTLPTELREARPGQIVSLVDRGSDGPLHEVIARRPATLDAPTRVAVEEYLFREWLAERRKGATITWHWE